MFLREVANLESVALNNLARVWLIDSGEHAKHCGLTRAVQTDDDNLAALIDCQIDGGEDFERTVALAQIGGHKRSLAAWRRIRKFNLRDTVLFAHLFEATEKLLCSLNHLLRGRCFRSLSAESRSLQLQSRSLLFGVSSLTLSSLFVRFALFQVVAPAHVIDVDNSTHGIKVKDSIHCLANQIDIVTDHD